LKSVPLLTHLHSDKNTNFTVTDRGLESVPMLIHLECCWYNYFYNKSISS
jgi:hypothetical protein